MSPTQTFALRILFPAAIGGLIATLILLIAPEWVLPHVETPAPEAQLLFEDLSPIEQQKEAAKKLVEFNGTVSNRPRGGGRPTKDDRRAIDRLMRRD